LEDNRSLQAEVSRLQSLDAASLEQAWIGSIEKVRNEAGSETLDLRRALEQLEQKYHEKELALQQAQIRNATLSAQLEREACTEVAELISKTQEHIADSDTAGLDQPSHFSCQPTGEARGDNGKGLCTTGVFFAGPLAHTEASGAKDQLETAKNTTAVASGGAESHHRPVTPEVDDVDREADFESWSDIDINAEPLHSFLRGAEDKEALRDVALWVRIFLAVSFVQHSIKFGF